LIFVFTRANLFGMSVQRLADLKLGDVVTVEHVGGERAFRRRLMELGLVPGTRVELVAVAPLGDPIELLVRGSSLSIRRSDAAAVRVARDAAEAKLPAGEKSSAGLATSAVRGAS
jgi:ferrous iron transport protein A